MRLYLASANPGKAAEFQALSDASRGAAGGVRIEVRGAAEVGGMPPVKEDTGSFQGNALKKARALHPLLPEGAWALADDSGLCVDALGGEPGVESAYFAGPAADGAANLEKLVEVMRAVPEGSRSAEFVCVLALRGPDGVERLFEGRSRGSLALSPRGRGGFGYDPLFVPAGMQSTLAELHPAEKNKVSHRGRAWAECVNYLVG